ncbi:MAG: dihydroorotase [Gammaproteobacteria bacterium]|nr:dihydroorotase [Gammaproteobacteria bacterium]
MQTLKFTQPDDWHCHLRDNQALARTVADSAACFGRAIVMPNLIPPITSIDAANAYRQRILRSIPDGANFSPLMTLYLTDTINTATLKAAKASEFINAVKLYPAGATTHSNAGIKNIKKAYHLFEVLEKIQLPLLIHAEVNDAKVKPADREAVFIDQYLQDLRQQFPTLKIVFEHASTKLAIEFVNDHKNIAATITPQHLLLTRDDLYQDGFNPHRYCLPVVKTNQDREALIKAATSGHDKFFLGTDSAPHTIADKASECCAAGIYNTPVALAIYAEIFEQASALNKLEKFASLNGAKFYELKINSAQIELIKKPWQVPHNLPFMQSQVVPLLAGQTLQWQLNHGYPHD